MTEFKTCPTCGSEYPMSERFCPRDGTALRSSNPGADIVGSVIADRYHVIKKLGEGGMGTVYLAEHVKMGRKSALKVMNPGMAKEADAIARFNREASNASRLNHPNICAIYDFGETAEGLVYLAMEFIEGESLTSIIHRGGHLPPARAASILHQAADALGVAHDYGIVHRDLKPDNIMIAKNRDGSDLVKVVDFGIAKASTSDAQKVTKTGLVVGTPEYMSPEQLAGDKLDGRSDIYSLALVGFNMLTGKLPFPSNSAQEAMIMRLTEAPKQLGEMKGDVAWPADLQAVFDKALARDVEGRYQKASDFGRELSMAVERMPSTALTEAGTMVIGAGGAAATSATAKTAAIPKTRVASSDAAPAAAPVRAPRPAAKGNAGMMMGVGGGVVAAVLVAVLYVSGVIGPDKSANGTTTDPAATPNDPSKQPGDPKAVRDTSDTSGARGSNAGRGDGGAARGNEGRQNLPPNPGGGGGNANPRGGANQGGGAATPTTDATLDAMVARLDRIVEGALNDSIAQAGIAEIAGAIGQARGTHLAKLYFFRVLFYEELNRRDDACRAAQSAINAGLSGPDLANIQGFVRDNCGLEACSS